MWLCSAVTAMSCSSRVEITGLSSSAVNTKSPVGRNLARAGLLEVDRLGYALRRGQCHSVIGDRPYTRNPEGKHTPGKAAFCAQRVFD